jgi:hypothetical protein
MPEFTTAHLFELRALFRALRRHEVRQLTVCAGKQKFESHNGAAVAARRHDMNVFRCPVCNFWHVGHSQLKLSRKKKRERLRACR